LSALDQLHLACLWGFMALGIVGGALVCIGGLVLAFAWLHDRWARRDRRKHF
jgi:hypothetical protein